MSNPSSAAYIFKRDHRSAARINLIHGLYTHLSDCLLHRSIPRPTTTTAAIVDIGTGTAIWPVELSDELADYVAIDGFDISSDVFPNKVFWPTNLNLYEQDCFKPFPAQFHGKYDVVNVRFFVTIVNTRTLKPLVRNLGALLKPGGYIQWIEPDNTICSPIAPPGIEHPAISKMCSIMKKQSPDIEAEWVLGLAKALQEEGYEDVATSYHPLTRKMRPFFGLINLLTFEDVRMVDHDMLRSSVM